MVGFKIMFQKKTNSFILAIKLSKILHRRSIFKTLLVKSSIFTEIIFYRLAHLFQSDHLFTSVSCFREFVTPSFFMQAPNPFHPLLLPLPKK